MDSVAAGGERLTSLRHLWLPLRLRTSGMPQAFCVVLAACGQLCAGLVMQQGTVEVPEDLQAARPSLAQLTALQHLRFAAMCRLVQHTWRLLEALAPLRPSLTRLDLADNVLAHMLVDKMQFRAQACSSLTKLHNLRHLCIRRYFADRKAFVCLAHLRPSLQLLEVHDASNHMLLSVAVLTLA